MADPAPQVTLTVKPNGPVLVVGPVSLVDPTGKAVTLPAGKPFALCRCGASKQKPFCDGSHGPAGFKAADPAPAR